ncbi:unnamed protein product [Rotaria sp. Silwood2]|nr:unnamed protein product [Rotaria sp. Silwood2]CAF3368694.1 unnamed protein product [Rotaria sp. Silwood2]CAF4083724.1 unnamed protein product [Rotaria sp. Silwood2]
MSKLLVFVVLLCVVLASCHPGESHKRGGNHGPDNGPQGKPEFWDRPHGNHNYDQNWASILCANDTLAQEYLTQTRQVINSFRSNETFTEALQNRQQVIAYIENENNEDLLSSNCTAFFIGLKSARNLDMDAMNLQRQLERIVGSSLFNIIQSLIGGNTFGVDD